MASWVWLRRFLALRISVILFCHFHLLIKSGISPSHPETTSYFDFAWGDSSWYKMSSPDSCFLMNTVHLLAFKVFTPHVSSWGNGIGPICLSVCLSVNQLSLMAIYEVAYGPENWSRTGGTNPFQKGYPLMPKDFRAKWLRSRGRVNALTLGRFH